MNESDPTGKWLQHTAWRAGSRRAVVECLSLCLLVREQANSMGADPKEADPTGDYDLDWYAQQAVALGYIRADQAAVLVGQEADAAAALMRTIWDFDTDPAFAEDRARDIQKRAVVDRLLSAEQRRALASGDMDVIEGIWREIFTHPDYRAVAGIVGPDWSLDWPAGTPADQVGPRRWRTRSPGTASG